MSATNRQYKRIGCLIVFIAMVNTAFIVATTSNVTASTLDQMGIGLVSPSPTAFGWTYLTVDASNDVGWTSSVATDSNNEAYIAYYDRGNGDLKFSTNAEGSWSTATIDSIGDVGYWPSICLDPQNNVFISYYDVTNGDLKYATNAGDQWTVTTLDNFGDVGYFSSIAIDSHNNVHIAYYDWTNGDLKYATNAGSIWTSTSVDLDNNVGYFCSIALDLNDNVHIAYRDDTNLDLKYATNIGGSWSNIILDSLGNIGDCPSITVDFQNNVHIAYSDLTNGDLKYATNLGGSWSTALVDDTSDRLGYCNSITVDGNGIVHIAYCDEANQDLKCASNIGGSWSSVIIDDSCHVGFYISMTVDSLGDLHISYFDWTNNVLKYAKSNTCPMISGISIPINPEMVNAVCTVGATYIDPDVGDSHTAVWSWDDGTTGQGNVVESTETITGSHAYALPGIYTVSLTVTDSFGESSTAMAQTYVVVYDPAGGFVTGGGWFNSPTGAYQTDDSLQGKANFGFVAKYQKGASVPSGNTEFQLKVAGLDFHSTSYMWLVVNQGGTNAQFKGDGTINGAYAPNGQDYKFMIWAGDHNPDTFRMKIWWEDGSIEHIVYDNGVQQAIAGGSIIVHTK